MHRGNEVQHNLLSLLDLPCRVPNGCIHAVGCFNLQLCILIEYGIHGRGYWRICCWEWPFWRKIKRENNEFTPINYPNYHFSLHDPFAIGMDYFGLFEILILTNLPFILKCDV